MNYAGRWATAILLAAVFAAAGAPAARAADYHWIGAGTGGNTATDPADPTTQWNNPANWLENKVPTSADKALLPLANAGYVNAATALLSGLGVDGPSAAGAYHIGDGAAVSTTPNYGVNVGLNAQGRIYQTGGSLTVSGLLRVGASFGGNGTYRLEGGTLTEMLDEYIGNNATGEFTQTGGTHIVNGTLKVAPGGSPTSHSTGTLNMGGGTLRVGSLYLYGGTYASGLLNITNSQAKLEIENSLTFYPKSTITAVPGSEIHIGLGQYPTFYNYSKDEKPLADLENVNFILEGTSVLRWMLFEVGGMDFGATSQGFHENFAIGSLVIGASYPAAVWLFDEVDNGNRSSAEALYVHNITILPGSELDLRGFHVYYDGTFVNQGTLYGGAPIFVPEPGTMAIFAAGMAALAFRRVRGLSARI